jgi:hypothetical protein
MGSGGGNNSDPGAAGLAGAGGYAGLDLLQAYPPQYWEAAQTEVRGLLAARMQVYGFFACGVLEYLGCAGAHPACGLILQLWCYNVLTVQEYARQAMLQHMQQVALYQQLAAQQLTGGDIQYNVLQQQQQALDEAGEKGCNVMDGTVKYNWPALCRQMQVQCAEVAGHPGSAAWLVERDV